MTLSAVALYLTTSTLAVLAYIALCAACDMCFGQPEGCAPWPTCKFAAMVGVPILLAETAILFCIHFITASL